MALSLLNLCAALLAALTLSTTHAEIRGLNIQDPTGTGTQTAAQTASPSCSPDVCGERCLPQHAFGYDASVSSTFTFDADGSITGWASNTRDRTKLSPYVSRAREMFAKSLWHVADRPTSLACK